MPKVSVIITCYNLGQYLDEAVNSVLSQTFQDFEIIIVNDGSNDAYTNELLNTYDKPKTLIYNISNQGLPNARNYGILRSSGKYLCCLDADDKYHPEFLEKTVKVFEEDTNNDYGIVATCFEVFENSNYKVDVIDFSKYILAVENVLQGASLFKRKCWEEVGGYATNLTGYEDWNFWLSIIAKGYKWFTVKEYLFFYRDRKDSMLKESDSRRFKLTNQIIKNNKEFYKNNAINISYEFIKHKDKLLNYNASILEAKKWFEGQLINAHAQLSQTHDQFIKLQTQLAQTQTQLAQTQAQIIPLISVIIPCFNYGRFISESIDSVLAQTFQNFEIIVVDGGSDDAATIEVLKNLNVPKTKIFFRNGRHFVGDNRNFGINLARGKYICCLDADDLLDPTYLEKALFFLETGRYDVVHPSVQCFGNKDIIWKADKASFENMISIGNYVSTVAVFRKEAWEKCGGFKDFGINVGHIPEDWEFWVRLIGNGYRFRNIMETLMLYRVHESGLTATCETTLEEQLCVIYNENRYLLSEKYQKVRNQNSNIGQIGKNPSTDLKFIKTKKRILFAFPFMIIGGADNILLRIIEFLHHDYDVSIITTIKSNPDYGSTFKQFSQYTKEIYNLQYFLYNEDEIKDFIMYLIESREIDLIFIVGCELMYNLLPDIKKCFKDIKIIDQLFNEIGHMANNRKYNKIIDLNIVANELIKNILVKKFREKIEKINVIIHGVDVLENNNPDKFLAADNLPITIPKDKLVVSYFGRCSHEKGPDLFVRIIKELRDYDIQAIMTGNGPEYSRIISYINTNKLSGNIYAPGFIDDIKSLLFKTDILVVPSRIDGLPIIIMEALAFGVPVVASKVGGIPSIIIDGYNGFLCESGNNDEFISKIKLLYNDRNLLSEMKKNAREYAVSNISEEKMNCSYKNAIENLIGL